MPPCAICSSVASMLRWFTTRNCQRLTSAASRLSTETKRICALLIRWARWLASSTSQAQEKRRRSSHSFAKPKPWWRRWPDASSNYYCINSRKLHKQRIKKMTLKALNKIINDETRHPQSRMSALFKKQELIIKRVLQMKKKQK